VTPWPEHLIHIIDFEGSLGSGVLEYGVVSWRAGEVVGAVTRCCRATGVVRADEVALHGLTAGQTAGEAGLEADFERFAEWRATGPLAAHFASAENTLIKSVWPYPRQSPDFGRSTGTVVEWGPWIDTGRIYPQLYRSLASARLEDLIEVFGLQSRLDELAARHCPSARCRYHAALYDALASMLLLDRLSREPEVAGRSLGWLLEMSTLDPDRRAEFQQRTLF
jgi:DNA polymerase III epsilon subunit-like protein